MSASLKRLREIFTPIAQDVEVPLEKIRAVAFDTNGTLVHFSGQTPNFGYTADPVIARFASDLISNQNELGIEVTIISSDAHGAKNSLTDAGLSHLLVKPVEDRLEFFARMGRLQTPCLVVDDSWLETINAQANVDPRSPSVRHYLEQRCYTHAPTPNS